MLAFGHSSSGVLVGAAAAIIGQNIHLPLGILLLVAFCLGIVAHYVGDVIPHGHYRFGVGHFSLKSICLFIFDFGAALAIFIWLLVRQLGLSAEFAVIICAIAGAQTPDVWEAAVDLQLVPKSRFAKLHRTFHYQILHWHNQPESTLPGHGRPIRLLDLWQVVIFGIGIWAATHLPHY